MRLGRLSERRWVLCQERRFGYRARPLGQKAA